jgi:hypothetical protein
MTNFVPCWGDRSTDQSKLSVVQVFSAETSGDYLVCPFTQETKGQMQMVCIESAINLNIEKPLVESQTDDIKCVPGRIRE